MTAAPFPARFTLGQVVYTANALSKLRTEEVLAASLTSSRAVLICWLNLTTNAMNDIPTPTQTIEIGDTVAYKLSGSSAVSIRGKVIGLVKTQDGRTLADVRWDKLGPPKRLYVQSLTKVTTPA